jgi:hypothetical protein
MPVAYQYDDLARIQANSNLFPGHRSNLALAILRIQSFVSSAETFGAPGMLATNTDPFLTSRTLADFCSISILRLDVRSSVASPA